MKIQIPGKFILDEGGNRVPVYADEKPVLSPESKVLSKNTGHSALSTQDSPATADSPAVEPATPITPLKKRSPK